MNMALSGSFFELVACRGTAEGFEATVRTLPGSIVYRAHFPGWPVTPGAVQVRMATEILGLRLGRTPELSCIETLKFLSPVLPGDELTFAFNGDAVLVLRGGETVSKMVLRYA